MATHVRVDRTKDLAELVIASPPLNLITRDLFGEMVDALRDLPGTARCLLLRAEGKVFCGGVDVHRFQGLDAEGGAALMTEMLALIQTLEALPIPTIAVVHGLNLTYGLELSLGCDLMWAAEDSRMGLVETTVGLTPAAGGTQRLVARAGAARAAEMVITGRMVPASELHAWGVVNELRPAGTLLDEARAYAEQLASGATQAMAAGKRLVREARDHGTAAADAITPGVSGPIFETEDAVTGINSLLAQGPGRAQFTGR